MTYQTGSLRFVSGQLKVAKTSKGTLGLRSISPYISYGSELQHHLKPFESVLDVYDLLISNDIFLSYVDTGRGAAKVGGKYIMANELSDREYAEITTGEGESEPVEGEEVELTEDQMQMLIDMGLLHVE